MQAENSYDVAIVGGGVAGLSAAIFAGRHDLDTVVLDAGESILRRNAHLENYPGFPAGVNGRLLLEMMRDQAQAAGATCRRRQVTRLRTSNGGFGVETASDGRYSARYVIAATKNAVDYMQDLDDIDIVDRGKPFVDVDGRGRTGVDGLYAAGRLAGKPHQTVVSAGHGAEVAVTLLEDHDRPFYHDWVVPEGYFTGRDREVPPGCEEIDGTERREREADSLATMREYFAEPHRDDPKMHPNVEPEDRE